MVKYHIKESIQPKEAFQIYVETSKPLSINSSKIITSSGLSQEDKKGLQNLFQSSCFLKELKPTEFICGISPAKASHVLYLLALTKSLYFEGNKILYDPFSKGHIYFQVIRDQDLFEISGIITTKKSNIKLHECDLVFEGDKIFYLYKGILSVIDTECDFEYLKRVQKHSLQLNKQQLDEFQRELSVDNLAPELKVKDSLDIKPVIACEPVLKLHDNLGVYASLMLSYGSYGLVEYGSFEKLKISRDLEEEKTWEADLIEAGYVRKKGPFSSYFCPQEKVFYSLRFLVELGWKVLDKKDRNIKLITKKNILVTNVNEAVELYGDLEFEEEKVSLDKVQKTLDVHENFVELSNNSVGLLEGVSFLKNVKRSQEGSQTFLNINLSELGLLEELDESCFDNSLKSYLKCVKKDLQLKDPGESFKGTLLNYQKLGFDWLSTLYDKKFNGLLADEMGLGKTVQVLALLSNIGKDSNHLIVVPTSLKYNWLRETEKFLGVTPCIFENKNQEIPKGIIIVSYGMLRQNIDLFQSILFKAIILDEAQVIKNPDSLVSKAVKSLKADFKLCITGTPIENKTLDLWSLFQFLKPELLGQKKVFESKYLDSKGLKSLSRLTGPYILRRKKSEVKCDLPERFEQNIFIEMSSEEKDLYQEMLTNSQDELKSDSSKLKIFELLLRLRQLCCHPLLAKKEASSSKLERLIYDVQELVETDKKVLIFSQFTSMLSLIKAALKEEDITFLNIEGSTKNRQDVVDEFQSGPVNVLLMSLKAAGVGLNIPKADTVIIYDPWWNSAVEEQAIARAHRIGREGSVFVKRYIMAESIEEKMMALKESKQKIFSEVIAEDSLTEGQLRNLLF